MARHASVRVLLPICILSVTIAAAPATADHHEEPPAETGGAFVGLAATVCTAVYGPLKIAYAGSGLLVGGMAWVWSFGSRRVTRPILRAALRGDYVVRPMHLRGQRTLHFIGRR
jgi:hypothetical protein